MPTFSAHSKRELATCHPDLVRVFEEVIGHVDCRIEEGHRSAERQQALYEWGKTTLPPGRSKHERRPSLAVDVYPYPVVWPNRESPTYAKDLGRWYIFAGFVLGVASQMRIRLRVGADWNGNWELNDQTFDDLPHFELVEEGTG